MDRIELAERRELVPLTSRLVQFLRGLATMGQPRVRDHAEYQQVKWLAELPAVADLATGAGPGEILLTIDAPPHEPAPEPPPEIAGWLSSDPHDATVEPELRRRVPAYPGDEETLVLAEEASWANQLFARWIGRWRVWAEAHQAHAAQREWYEDLSRAAHLVSQRDDEFEVVLATGLLTWAPRPDERLRNHILTTPVRLAFDPGTARIEVRLADDVTTRCRDRDLLDGEDGFLAASAEPVRELLRTSVTEPLSDAFKEHLEQWRVAALPRCHPYNHDWQPPRAISDLADLRFAPALVLRPRDRGALLDYYDRMLAALSGPDAVAPLGLAQLVKALDANERMEWLEAEGAASGGAIGDDPLFPLPANPEQRQIMRRLRSDNGVVVQGPPGTGKTHTIANLISALLATGQRVLVTSQKAQALRVLREKLPPAVRDLCVSMTDVSRGGSMELSRAVNSLSERYSTFDPSTQAGREDAVAGRRAAAVSREASLREDIRALRETETYQHPTIAPGYQGTLASIAAELVRRREALGWMPVPLRSTDEQPPLTVAEAVELRQLLIDGDSVRQARPAQTLPSLDSVPSVATIAGMVADEQAASAHAGQVETSLSQAVANLPDDVLRAVEQDTASATGALHELGLTGDPRGWDAVDWQVRAIGDLFGSGDGSRWHRLAALAPEAESTAGALRKLGLRQVTVAGLAESGPASAEGQLGAADQLVAYLRGGGKLKKRMRSATQKAAEPILTGATVDGSPLTSVELVEMVRDWLTVQVKTRALARQWAAVGVGPGAGEPVEVQVDTLTAAHRDLRRLLTFAAQVDRVRRGTQAAGALLPLRTPVEWFDLTQASAAVRARKECERATADLSDAQSQLDLLGRSTAAPPEVGALAEAVAARDVERYRQTLGELADAFRQQADQRRCDELFGRLHIGHPVLATQLLATCRAPEWDDRLAALPDAWSWGRAQTFFADQRDPNREQRLDAELAGSTAQVQQMTAELAAERAWGRCLERMTAHQAQALRAYQAAITSLGKGTGRYAPRFAAAAREAMVDARGAVPAWIMPLPEVLETIPPDRDSFDVVIVDEASQAGMESLFLLWLAPRVIVVGDDRQCTPSVVTRGELQPIFDKLDSYLPDLPGYLRDAFTPKSSLFSLLATRFSSVIRLREHFRCMPEIIDWPSRQFYQDSPLVPLRQFGADRLNPLELRHVPGASTVGSGTGLRNLLEAEAIADQLAACVDDPRYDGRSFGVVVLQGTGQVEVIDRLLRERIPPDEYERRRIRVGTPPDFQGDERHVVFLSMVAAERRTAQTSMDAQRRFNVAASRAQDQMWLFHSMTADLCRPADLRRSLLGYFAAPPAPMAGRALGVVRADEPHEAFDSLFEQRVYLAIQDRGYAVTPQVEVNGRRIDLVVTGAKGRLAVECDGDYWHSSPSQVADDVDREQELRRAGWKFWRVRESEFNYAPEVALSSLWDALAVRGIEPGVEQPVAVVPDGEWTAVALSIKDDNDLDVRDLLATGDDEASR